MVVVCLSEFTSSTSTSSSTDDSIVRIAGAVLSFLYPSNNVGVEAATFALLSAGGLPLLLSMTLLLNNVYVSNDVHPTQSNDGKH